MFKSLFNKEDDLRLKDQIAEFLKTNPEKLDAFENAYRLAAIEEDKNSSDIYSVSAKEYTLHPILHDPESIQNVMIQNIAKALVSETATLSVTKQTVKYTEIGERFESGITNEHIRCLPEDLRPQLTERLIKSDLQNHSSLHILDMLKRSVMATNEKEQRRFYHMFRQGLDILDLDGLMYEILGRNANSMSHWLPAIANAAAKTGFFRIPDTKIAKVPLPILQLSRLDYGFLTPTTLAIVDEWARNAFDLDENKKYFIKTGTYSSKFDFRNAVIKDPKEVREIGQYLLFIQNQAVMMAGPLTTPSIYGVSTTNEWVVREYIEDVENNPTIYKGMPLHTEYRVFVDFDTNEVLAVAPYWEPNVMKKRFAHADDAASPHNRHDYIIYKMHEDVLMERFCENRDRIHSEIQKLLPETDLSGQWSVDVMQNGNDFWIIDMATANTSALNEYIPVEKRKIYPEDWLPVIE